MNETTVFLVLVAVATLVLVFVVALPDPRRGALIGEAEGLVRNSATAAIAALSTSLMYLAQAATVDLLPAATGSVVALAVGDGMMVLAGWMLWAALSAVNGRTLVPPLLAVAAAVTSGTISLFVPETTGTAVKLVIVGIGCLVLGVESLLGRVRETSVYGVFTGVGFGFGGYTLVRVGVIAFLGTDSTVYARAFTTLVSTLISGLAITAATVGVVLLFRQIAARPPVSTAPAMAASVAEQVLAQGRSLNVYSLDVADLDLIRRAHGIAAAQAVRDSLIEAAAVRLPSGVLALAPGEGHLTVVEAERRGEPSAAADLVRAFDAAIERAGLPELVEVDVERSTVRTRDELAEMLARAHVSPVEAGA